MGSARNVIGGIFGVLGYMFRFLRLMLMPKAVLVAKLHAVENQLAACVDEKAPKPRFSFSFRVLWGIISRWLRGWRLPLGFTATGGWHYSGGQLQQCRLARLN